MWHDSILRVPRKIDIYIYIFSDLRSHGLPKMIGARENIIDGSIYVHINFAWDMTHFYTQVFLLMGIGTIWYYRIKDAVLFVM